MADTAAHVVDHVLPLAPVRQWVLSLPFALRFAVVFDRELCRVVRSAFIDTVLVELRRRALQQGVVDGRSGAVVAVQRFGGSINLDVHSKCVFTVDVLRCPGCDGRRCTLRAGHRACSRGPEEQVDTVWRPTRPARTCRGRFHGEHSGIRPMPGKRGPCEPESQAPGGDVGAPEVAWEEEGPRDMGGGGRRWGGLFVLCPAGSTSAMVIRSTRRRWRSG